MSLSGIEAGFERLNDLWTALIGVVVGVAAASLLLAFLRGFEPAWLAWLIAAAIALGLIVVVVKNESLRAVAFAALLAYGATLAFMVRHPLAPIEKAQAIARDKPFCIQVSDGGTGYRPAAAKADLTGLTMRARRGPYHAVMAVGEGGNFDLYNWSYRNGKWMALRTYNVSDDASDWIVIRCQPRTDFVKALPLVRLTRGALGESVRRY